MTTRTFRPELVQRPRRGQTREAGADHDVLRLLVHRGERDGMCLGVSKATTKKKTVERLRDVISDAQKRHVPSRGTSSQ